eukprot:TRINITY_DN3655_c0_g1_i2.p1 TRINITY_DN3655_c0_g1~~TRINITY_DN3655_c0_g1_i2.p1  ORF type:complete len:380 (-),score=47.75 TRINITY_DN3655_c0_g1_i2:135-1274(-)
MLKAREAAVLLGWLGSAFFWALVSTLISIIPFTYLLRPKDWCVWKAEDISPTWMTEKLREGNHIGPDDVVARLEVQGLVPGGRLGIVTRLNVYYTSPPKAEAPRTLIVKQNAPGFAGRFICCVSSFVGEFRFYEEIRKFMPASFSCPTFYHGQQFLGTDMLVIMSDASPGTPGPDSSSETVPLPILRKMVRELAKFQAHFWNDQNILSASPYLRKTKEEQENKKDGRLDILMRANVDTVWDLYRKVGGVFPENWTKETLDTVVNLHSKIEPYLLSHLPRVVTHSDFRVGNILITQTAGSKTSKTRCSLVDWQGTHWGHPFRDFGYLMSTDLNTITRRRVEREMLQYFMYKLGKYGVDKKDLDFDDAFDHYVLGVMDCKL